MKGAGALYAAFSVSSTRSSAICATPTCGARRAASPRRQQGGAAGAWPKAEKSSEARGGRRGRRRRRRQGGEEGGEGEGEGGGGGEGRAVLAADRDVDELVGGAGRRDPRCGRTRVDKLYVETIDLGEGTPRTVLAGGSMTLDQGSVRVVTCNPAAEDGGDRESAMVLCARRRQSKLVFVEERPPAPRPATSSRGGLRARLRRRRRWTRRKRSPSSRLATDAKGVATYKGAPCRRRPVRRRRRCSAGSSRSVWQGLGKKAPAVQGEHERMRRRWRRGRRRGAASASEAAARPRGGGAPSTPKATQNGAAWRERGDVVRRRRRRGRTPSAEAWPAATP